MEMHTGNTLVQVDSYDVIECAACGFAHIMPLLTEEELTKFYEAEFYEQERPDYFKHAEEDKEWWRATYYHYYDLLEAHTSGRRLADIGSGPGYFLDAGRERGWEIIGFEPSPTAARYSSERGLSVVEGLFTAEEAKKHGPFDVIMLSLVLEHVRDPHALVALCAEALAPGGVLCVISPNDFNPLQKLLVDHSGYNTWWVVPKHHQNYFNSRSLGALLEAHGLRVVEQETTYPMEFFLLAGRNYVGHPEVGRACHAERKAFELALFAGDTPLLKNMYKAWAAQGIGRELVFVAQKQ